MSASKKDVLLDQLAACHNDLSWFPTFLDAVKGLTAEQAAWRKDESSHSIWQLVSHLTYWNKTWLARFIGKESFTSTGKNNAGTFDIEEEISEENWVHAVSKLDELFNEFRKAISDHPESKLDTFVAGYPGDCPWWAALSNLCTHNAYHIGQIVFIRKQQGWANRSEW
ncbi:DinB family protein [Paenibacillus thermotolerans]|uniref:DinB family protein n=1 Tax=Paenibacillus thermotolerans TaxID=3027807 RepID=UPI002367BB1B|nr:MULTISPECIES: DinB family protein [unclassified Paenibacillus]